MNKIKWLYLDIENAPNIAYTWAKYQQDVIDFAQEHYLLSYAYKWDGKKTRVKALPDYKTWKNDKTNDFELVSDLWQLLDEADVICGHNIDRFDLRKINARFLYHGMSLPSPYKTVDTLKVARKMFMLNSNKLDHIAKYLKIGTKVETGGFQLWLECMAGQKPAWRKMKEYNKHDVDLTEKVYLELRPYITNHPNANLYRGTDYACPSCGSNHVQKRGFRYTTVGKRQSYQCVDCSSWSQGEIVRTEAVLR